MNDDEAEKLRQEGRQEVLDYLVAKEIINYSSYDNEYFKYNWKTEIMTILPWQKPTN